jgi:putative PIN family toxin of toxin-antitoxin system
MQKLIVDTNILVSAIIQKSYPYLIVRNLFISDKIALCVSDELVKEYYAVLGRKKFSKYADFISTANMLMTDIESKAILYTPKTKLQILADPDDDKLLELAHESKADFLITGNTNDFTIDHYRKTKIITPKEYWELYKS